MGAVWQVQEAKNRFSELIGQAWAQGPQVITRHGKPIARVVAARAEDSGVSLAIPADPLNDGFANYLLRVPDTDGIDLAVRRSKTLPPELGD